MTIHGYVDTGSNSTSNQVYQVKYLAHRQQDLKERFQEFRYKIFGKGEKYIVWNGILKTTKKEYWNRFHWKNLKAQQGRRS